MVSNVETGIFSSADEEKGGARTTCRDDSHDVEEDAGTEIPDILRNSDKACGYLSSIVGSPRNTMPSIKLRTTPTSLNTF